MSKKFGIDVQRKSKIPELNKKVETMANSTVRVGVLDTSGSHEGSEGLTVADVASFMEFGTTDSEGLQVVPERSFIRSTIDESRPELREVARKLQAQILTEKQMTPAKALGLLGQKLQSLIINKINSGIDPELDEKTIARKGSSTPLIDTGQLKQSIRYKVDE